MGRRRRSQRLPQDQPGSSTNSNSRFNQNGTSSQESARRSVRSHPWYVETEEGQPPPIPSQHFSSYKFRELQNCFNLLLLVPCVILMFINYAYCCNGWMAIVELCGNVFLVACDVLFLLRFPKFPIFTLFVSCTVVICVMQYVGNYALCRNLDWPHESVLSYLPYILFVPYCVKVYYLFLLLKANFITLQSMLLADFRRQVILSYPIMMTYHTPGPIYELDHKSENLLTIALLIPVLEGLLLRGRSEIQEGDDNTTYFDGNMEVVTMYISVKNCLYLCEAALEETQADYEEVSRKLECVKKSYSEVKNQRDGLKKQLDDQNEQSNALSRDLGKANQVVADLRKQLSKQQANINCCICHDRMKTILL
ncbi:uncharacterized protein [Dysidea avara]|uniref:uncharacterized protein n=1 Tax=Dysidea avara TaxID=196820 RepID=UPI00331A5F42